MVLVDVPEPAFNDDFSKTFLDLYGSTASSAFACILMG